MSFEEEEEIEGGCLCVCMDVGAKWGGGIPLFTGSQSGVFHDCCVADTP